MNEKSLIGRLYTPIDNSYEANLSNQRADKTYLAGTNSTESCITEIVSDPFDVPIISIYGDKKPNTHKMVIVAYNNQTYITMFHDWGLIEETTEPLNLIIK